MFDGQFYPGQAPQFSIGQPRRPIWFPRTSLLDITTRLGLTANRRLVLDAGDGSSFTSGQRWLDRSGNGYDFFRGTTSGAEASDPTFNGSAGDLSSAEYFSCDGGDVFRYDTTNETWMQNIHKNNAAFTLVTWFYPTTGIAQRMAGTSAGATVNVGFSFIVDSVDRPQLTVQAALVAPNLSYSTSQSSLSVVPSAWNFIGISIAESTGTGTLQVNGSQLALTPTYATPSAANATYTMEICANGNAAGPVAAGDRMATFAAWEGAALSAGQLNSLWVATRPRFGV